MRGADHSTTEQHLNVALFPELNTLCFYQFGFGLLPLIKGLKRLLEGNAVTMCEDTWQQEVATSYEAQKRWELSLYNARRQGTRISWFVTWDH